MHHGINKYGHSLDDGHLVITLHSLRVHLISWSNIIPTSKRSNGHTIYVLIGEHLTCEYH